MQNDVFRVIRDDIIPTFQFRIESGIRWKALDEIYKIYMLLHRWDLNILANSRQTFSHFFDKFVKIHHFRLIFIKICSDFDENLSEFRQILSNMLSIRDFLKIPDEF